MTCAQSRSTHFFAKFTIEAIWHKTWPLLKFMGHSRKWNDMTSLQKDMQQRRLDQINLWISAVWSEPLLTSQRSFCLWLSMECQAKTQIRLLGWSVSSLGTHISLLCQSLPYKSAKSAKFGHWKKITEIILKFEQWGFTFNWVIHPKDADRIAKSDCSFRSSLIWVYTVCGDLPVWIPVLGIITYECC